MATIKSAIQLYDGVSPALKSMNKALNTVLSSFEAMQEASSNSVDTSAIKSARNELAKVETTLDGVESNIKDADAKQRQFNEDIRNGDVAAGNLKSKFLAIAGAIGGVIGLKKVLDLSDELTQTTARLNMMNDGLQTTEELQNKIFASAQRSRVAYSAMADVVGKLGNQAKGAFKSNDETIAFAETLNKMFTVSGLDSTGIESTMYNLTQSLASGALMGQDYRILKQNAPQMIKILEDFYGVSRTELDDMVSKGQVSAEALKTAMLNASGDINAQFEAMPKTIGQIWTGIKNQALNAFQPILSKISEIANSDKFQKLANSVVTAITLIAGVAVVAFELISNIASFLYDNWNMIEPIVLGVVAAMIAYNTVAAISSALTLAHATAEGVKAAAQAMATGATFAETAAQYGLNAALMACPITWIVLAVIALVAAIVAVCNWIAKTTGVAQTGFGVITGGIAVVGATFKNLGLLVANIALGIWEAIGACCSNIGTAFHNVISSVQSWWYNLLSTALTVVAGICEALNKLPFVDFDYSGITSKADAYAAKASEAAGNKESYKSVSDAFSKGFNTYDAFGDGWASDAFQSGAAWGDGVVDKVKGMFSTGDSELDAYNTASLMDNLASSSADTAGNTAAMKDSMDTLEDSLEYMVDIAEREAINRFTTAEIKVDMTNNNNISSDMDIDGVCDALSSKIYEAMLVSAEGVHN